MKRDKSEKLALRIKYHKGYIEAGLYNGLRRKGHEDNNIFFRMVNFEKDEQGFDITVDEAAAIIQVLSAAIFNKTINIREKL